MSSNKWYKMNKKYWYVNKNMDMWDLNNSYLKNYKVNYLDLSDEAKFQVIHKLPTFSYRKALDDRS